MGALQDELRKTEEDISFSKVLCVICVVSGCNEFSYLK